MPFRFPLQTLLRLRHGFEHVERLRLEALTRRVFGVQQHIETLENEKRAAWIQLAGKLRRGIRGGEFRSEAMVAEVQSRRRRSLLEQLEQLQAQRQRQQAAFRKAQQDREILDNLRTRLLEAYHLVELRRQQQQLDDTYLMRRLWEERG